MNHLPLHFGDDLAGIAFIPMPVEMLGHRPELDNQVVRQILGLNFAALLPPEAEQGRRIVPHDDPGIGTAYKGTSFSMILHANLHRHMKLNLSYDNKSVNEP
jgi:hypothetical protein